MSNISVTMIVPGPIQTAFLSESFTDTQGEVNNETKIINQNNSLQIFTKLFSNKYLTF